MNYHWEMINVSCTFIINLLIILKKKITIYYFLKVFLLPNNDRYYNEDNYVTWHPALREYLHQHSCIVLLKKEAYVINHLINA